MSFTVQIAHSVQEIGPEAWDRLSGNRPFASFRWYRYGEAALSDNTPIYIILSHSGQAIARATLWLRREEPIPLTSKLLRSTATALLRRRPLLLCQSPLANTSGLILPDPPLREAALTTIGQVALEQARQHKASFLAWVYLEPQEARLAGWPDAFAAVELPEPGTRLRIAWPDFDHYLDHMGRRMRQQYQRHCRQAAAMDIVVSADALERPLDEATLEQALRLIRNVEARHNSLPAPWARRALEHASMVDGLWLTARVGERLVGCGVLLADGEARMMALLGRDYSVDYAYFPLIYTALRCAIEQGTRVLWGGAGAYEMKLKLGFEMTNDSYAVFAGNGPLLQRLGRWMAGTEERRAVALRAEPQRTPSAAENRPSRQVQP